MLLTYMPLIKQFYLKMFRDDNDQFMKSFGGFENSNDAPEVPSPTRPPISERATKKLAKYAQNASFNMVSEQSDEKSFQSGENSQRQSSEMPEKIDDHPKRVNWIKQSMPTSRRFSDANLVISIKKYQEVQPVHEMECIDQGSEAVSSEIFDTQTQVPAPDIKENQPPEQNPQTYFMKKVRALQTKFKQMNLYYDNMVMQLKATNKQTLEELQLYKQHVQKYQPGLQKQIEEALQKQRESASFMSSSSSGSSKKTHNFATPIYSQMIEIKIQGKKLCDTVKQLSNKIKELQKPATVIPNDNFQSAFQAAQSGNYSPVPYSLRKKNSPGKNEWSRKYSIPAIYSREKKQSFQTTIISQKQQTVDSNQMGPSSGNLCSRCSMALSQGPMQAVELISPSQNP